MKGSAIFQVVGYKNSGKTTLICELIRRLTETGYRVGTAKHDAHQFEIDHRDTDTWKIREAGAQAVAITSGHRTAFMEERNVSLEELLQRFQETDIVLVEGFKKESYPKIVLIRTEKDLELLHITSNVRAIISWLPLDSLMLPIHGTRCFSIHDVDGILALILEGVNSSLHS